MKTYKNYGNHEYPKALSAKLSNTLRVMGTVGDYTTPKFTGLANLSDEEICSFFEVLSQLETLTYKQRVCWLAKTLGGMNCREIANVLGISFKNVAKHVQNANKILGYEG